MKINVESFPFVEPEESDERPENLWIVKKCIPYLAPIEQLIMMYIYDLYKSEREVAKIMNLKRIIVNKRKLMACQRMKVIYADILAGTMKKKYYLHTKYSEKTC